MTLEKPKYIRGDKVKLIRGKRKGEVGEVSVGMQTFCHVKVNGEPDTWPVVDCEKVQE